MTSEFETYLQELRRGTIVLACLQLLRSAGYGYGLLADLDDRGFVTDANTLYPLLRRLEKQGYLTSEWDTDGARPRKFYRTSPDGSRLAEALSREWLTLTGAIDSLAIDSLAEGHWAIVARANSPGADSPGADSPGADSSHADSSHADSSHTHSPGADSPHTDSPRGESSHVDNPRVEDPPPDTTRPDGEH